MSTVLQYSAIIELMCVGGNDYRFTESQQGGWQIAYGEAGDCYSVIDCPQGQFKINLKGTGLSVSPKTRWLVQGNKATKHIERSHVRHTSAVLP